MKESFIIYTSFYEPIKELSDKQLGRIFRALFDYHVTGNRQVDDDIRMAFLFFKNQMDIDRKRYIEMCDKRKQAAVRGGAPKGNSNARKKTSESDNDNKNNQINQMVEKTTKTTLYDNDHDNDNDNDNDLKKVLSDDNTKEIEIILPFDELSFENVWELYEKKGNRKTSKKRWANLKNHCREAALTHIPLYVMATPDKQFRKNFESYINQECWNDEIITKSNFYGNNSTNKGLSDEEFLRSIARGSARAKAGKHSQ